MFGTFFRYFPWTYFIKVSKLFPVLTHFLIIINYLNMLSIAYIFYRLIKYLLFNKNSPIINLNRTKTFLTPRRFIIGKVQNSLQCYLYERRYSLFTHTVVYEKIFLWKFWEFDIYCSMFSTKRISKYLCFKKILLTCNSRQIQKVRATW